MLSSPDKQDRMISILEDLRRWTRLQGAKTLKELFHVYVNDERKRLIYHLSDGKSSREIGSIAKVHHSTVVECWKLWAPLGLVEINPNFKGRYHRAFSLEDVGLDTPAVDSANLPREQQGTPGEEPKGLEVFTKETPQRETQNGG